MVTTPGWASTQASASCAGVQPTSSASFFSAGLRDQPALVERRVGHQRDRALAHQRQQVELRPAPRQAVQHLVGAGQALVEAGGVLHVAAVEVADAEVGDLPGLAQAMERLERLLQPRPAAPVQQVEIDALEAQALEAALAGGNRARARGIVGIDLAHDVGLGPSLDRLADDLLGNALAVHLGGVDHGIAELEPVFQGIELIGAPPAALAHAPGSEAENRHDRAGRKFAGTHKEHPSLQRRSDSLS